MPNQPHQSCTLPAVIEVSEAKGKTSLQLWGPHIDMSLPDASAWDALEGLAKVASARLSEVGELCRSPVGETERDRALDKIRSIGTIMWSRIIGHQYRGICRNISLGPGSLMYGPRNPPIMDVALSCTNDNLVLPVEILPLLLPVGSDAQLGLQSAAALVGFGAACHRDTTTPRHQADEALLDPKAVRFYWHARLDLAQKQWKWLSERFDTEGPHPEKGEDSGIVADLIVFKGRGKQRPIITVAIEHFHCHHERRADKQTPQEDVIRLKAAGLFSWLSPEVRITADQLARLEERAAGLVFLNACSSQPISARAVSSFARELLSNGRSAVVTTWSDVPEDVALAMARFFYEALLRGETVGASLREARVRLLLKHNNPLGLLYTVYGNSHFRLTDIGTHMKIGGMRV